MEKQPNGQWCVRVHYLAEKTYNVSIRFINAESLRNHKRFNQDVVTLLSAEQFYYYDTHKEAIIAFETLTQGRTKI